MEKMNSYLIDEIVLKELIESNLKLVALECGGVDNWMGYGWSIEDFISQWVKDKKLNPDEEWDFSDIVEDELSKYKVFKTE